MEGEKIYAMCESIIKNKRDNKLVITLLKFDKSLTLGDLINEVFLHHFTEGIYPSHLTVNRFLINWCKSRFRIKRGDNRELVDDADFDKVVDVVGFHSLGNVCDLMDIDTAMKKLRKEDIEIIKLYFFDGWSQNEIGKKLGRSEEYVRLRLRDSIRIIRGTIGM